MKAAEHAPDPETREFILKGGNLNETDKIILNNRAEQYAFRVMKPHLIDRSDSIPVFTASGAGIPLDGGIVGEYDINIYSHIKHEHRQHMLKEYILPNLTEKTRLEILKFMIEDTDRMAECLLVPGGFKVIAKFLDLDSEEKAVANALSDWIDIVRNDLHRIIDDKYGVIFLKEIICNRIGGDQQRKTWKRIVLDPELFKTMLQSKFQHHYLKHVMTKMADKEDIIEPLATSICNNITMVLAQPLGELLIFKFLELDETDLTESFDLKFRSETDVNFLRNLKSKVSASTYEHLRQNPKTAAWYPALAVATANFEKTSKINERPGVGLKTELFFNKLFEFDVQKLTTRKVHSKTIQQILDNDTKIPKILEYLLENVDLVLAKDGVEKTNYFKLCNTLVKKVLAKQSQGELDGCDTVFASFLKTFSDKLLEDEGYLLKLYAKHPYYVTILKNLMTLKHNDSLRAHSSASPLLEQNDLERELKEAESDIREEIEHLEIFSEPEFENFLSNNILKMMNGKVSVHFVEVLLQLGYREMITELILEQNQCFEVMANPTSRICINKILAWDIKKNPSTIKYSDRFVKSMVGKHGNDIIVSMMSLNSQSMIPLVIGCSEIGTYLENIEEAFFTSKMNNQTKFLMQKLSEATENSNCPEHIVNFVDVFKKKIKIHDLRVHADRQQKRHFAFLFPDEERFQIADKLSFIS